MVYCYLFYIQILHDKQLLYCPFPNKIKMYSWSPFSVTAYGYQTPVGRTEASRIDWVSNEP